MASQVEIQGVSHWYGERDGRRQVLFDVDLDLAAGEIVIMTGPSGSGKTTLLTLIGALRSVQHGKLRVLDHQLAGLAPGELVDVRRNIGFIFQAHNLFDSLTAAQNVHLALGLHDLSAKERQERADEMLRRVGLEDRAGHKPQALSGGQRQRVAIARALVNRPRLVLADEPTAALDKDTGKRVVELFQELCREYKTTILLVTHDSRILDTADRIVNLVDGRVVSNVDVERSIEICGFLSKSTIFSHHTPGTLNEIAQNVVQEQRRAGEVIFNEGDAGDRFYIVRRGAVEVLRASAGGTERLATLRSGDFFGEAALLTDGPRNATVRVVEDVDLFALDKPQFKAALETSKTFREQLLEIFLNRR